MNRIRMNGFCKPLITSSLCQRFRSLLRFANAFLFTMVLDVNAGPSSPSSTPSNRSPPSKLSTCTSPSKGSKNKKKRARGVGIPPTDCKNDALTTTGGNTMGSSGLLKVRPNQYRPRLPRPRIVTQVGLRAVAEVRICLQQRT